MLLMDLEKDKTNLKEPLWDLMAWKLGNSEAWGIKYLDFDSGKAPPSELSVHRMVTLSEAWLGNHEKRARFVSRAFQLPTEILLLPYPALLL